MPKVLLRRGPSNGQPNNVVKGLDRLLEEGQRTRPHFSQCWVMPCIPQGARTLEEYSVGNARIKIMSLAGEVAALYHITPWEYHLSSEVLSTINGVIERVVSTPPRTIDSYPEATKEYVVAMAYDELRKALRKSQTVLGLSAQGTEDLIWSLCQVVTRYTIGYGLLEILLSDKKLEDIYIDAPAGSNPIHVTFSGLTGTNNLMRCDTNIIASENEVTAFVSRMKHQSGRPFSEAFPTMETDVGGFEARATVVGLPLSPNGTALALRRHSSTPWTLLKMAHSGTIDALTAGLISFLIDGRSTILVCGPRGAGKSSMLGAIMFEFPPNQRILTIEDTAELPVRRMQSIGFKVQSLLVQQRLGESQEEKTEEALRVSLRLGESAIILGEVRGREAKVLYDSMRTGKAGSSVLGTMHGDSAKSVYERVVHDLGIAKEAFNATDAVITMGLTRPGGSQRPLRKMIDLSECSRLGPGQFRTLVELGPEGKMMNRLDGHSELISRIAAAWGIEYEEALENIQARAGIRKALLHYAKANGEEYLSPEWAAKANLFLWEKVERGEKDFKQVVKDFQTFLERG